MKLTYAMDHQVAPACERLSDEERDMLQTIFRKRLRLFLLASGIVFLMVLGASLAIDSPAPRFSNSYHGYMYKPDDSNFHISREIMRLINFCFLGSIVLAVFISIFRRRVWCFYKDLKSNTKEAVYYEVVRKHRSEYTNQFFLGLNNPDYPFHEVDEQTWLKVPAGTLFPLYRAPFSRYIFNFNGKYTII